jgi:signal transduction histidine kinase
VLLYTHLLLDACPVGSAQREDLLMIVEQADRCKKIVAGLLHFARQNKVLREPTDLACLLERGLQAIVVPENIQANICHGLHDAQCEVDRDQILQVLTNLVTNAVDAMPGGGTLTLRTADTPDSVRFEVGDTGTGILEADMGRIFDPFFTTKPIGKGTGLGLAVTYGIVKMHNGSISVVSNADPATGPCGTTFTVVLPRTGSG